MNLKPLADRVVVRPSVAEERTKGGIIVPDTAKEKPVWGEIIAVGPGKLLDSGKLAPMDVKAGDIVVFTKYGGTEIKLGDQEYVILRQEDILAVLEKSATNRAKKTGRK